MKHRRVLPHRITSRAGCAAILGLMTLATSACSSASTANTPAPTVVVTSSLDVWVAPGGTGGDGSREHPFGSLTAARDAARSRAARAGSDLTIHLADGTYTLDQPLYLSARDSGQNNHNVIWRSDGGSAIISGGIRITGWRAPSGSSPIWTAMASATLQTRQLYVNGDRAQLAQGLMHMQRWWRRRSIP